jgi:hypothetical protein
LDDQVHFAGREGNVELARPVLQLDVLPFALPITLDGERTWVAPLGADVSPSSLLEH